jgi:polyisoprenoid-binding protein YceI
MKKLASLSFVVAATVAALFSMQSVSSSQGKAAHYEIDGSHSAVVFRVKHVDISYTYGRFDDISGTVDFGGSNAVSITIKTASVNTGNDKRDGHLQSPDFFAAKEFPTITFESTGWKSAGGDSYDVTGNLTLHGVTKSVTARVEKTGEGDRGKMGYRIGFHTEFDVKRSDFGMTKLAQAVGDDVHLAISVEGVRK